MRFLPRQQQVNSDSQDVRRLMDSGYDEIIARLLVMREIYTPDDARSFLNPDESMLHDPLLMLGMDKAVNRIDAAISAGENIVIYGDYDADGVTAVSILKGYFDMIGAAADYYIPSRHFEGYGLNNTAVKMLAENHSLMITVDCGIDCFHEIEYSKSLGMDVVVTDHHQMKDLIPDATAVLNPLMGDYPFRKLCGAGVALKLVQALGGMEATLEFVDLAAIGTIADIVPLLGENRAITAIGLERLNKKIRPGINAICKSAGLRGKAITSGHIGYMIGPRINAGGRIDRSAKSVDLLLTQDEEVAAEIAAQLEEHNSERQRLERQITVDCERMLETDVDFINDRAIVLMHDDWNLGVVGIVASRLTEKWSMPVLLFARDEDSITGSGRSVSGVHIFKAISACSHLLTRFGGHEMAAGMTMPAENFEQFKKELNDYLKKHVPQESFTPKAYYDIEIGVNRITMQLCRQLDQLLPCGMGNPTPTFMVSDVKARDIKLIGADQQHVKCAITQENHCGQPVDCVGFSMAYRAPMLEAPVDMLVQLGVNEWNDRVYLQTIIRSCAPSLSAFDGEVADRYDEIMRRFLCSALSTDEGGDADCPEIPAIDELPQLGRGDMLIYHNPENLSAAESAAAFEKGVIARFVGKPDDDRRAFPCLVAAPLPDESFVRYRRFIFADEPWKPFAQKLKEACPGAEILMISGGRAMSLALPDREEMRKIYSFVLAKATQLNLCLTLREASEKASCEIGVSKLVFICALMVFAELGFLTIDAEKWRLELTPKPEKRDLSQSRLWRCFGAK